MRLFLLFFCSTPLLFAQTTHRLAVTPLDIAETDVGFYPESIHQLEVLDGKILIRNYGQASVLALEPDGTPTHTIGGPGGHPSEMGGGVLALAVGERHLWALDAERKRVRLFRDNRYHTSFPIERYNVHFAYPTSNVFAGTEEVVVVPTHPETGFLATAFAADGTMLRHVGRLPVETTAVRETIPGADDTFWLTDGHRWLAIHKFYPLVSLFDDQFELVGRFQPDSPIIAKSRDRVDGFAPSPERGLPMPVFTDAKLHDGALYLMSTGHLHRIDWHTGTVEAIYAFYGEGEDFVEVTAPFLTLFSFALLPGHRVVLGHPAMLWNHDLWTTRLPSP